MKRKVHCMFFILTCMAALPACATSLTYSAEPIEAKVIDAETKWPIEGVVVTANWQLEQGTMGGNIQVGQLMVMETVTDKDGRFSFPAWGPKTAWQSFLVNDDPQLLLFKSGYEYRRLFNRYTSDRELRTRSLRRSDWNGKTIELTPFKGTMVEWAEHVSNLGRNMDFMLDFGRGEKARKDCNWKKTPRMLAVLHKMSLYFDAQGVKLKGWRGGEHVLRIQDIPRDLNCGSVDEFFRSYLQ